jgi:uncharacterized CHY-type Zn-finger protein
MSRPPVSGLLVDSQTRCAHWHGPFDVVALRFPCCGRYHPCRECHDACAGHPARRWPAGTTGVVAMCGVCSAELTAPEYLGAAACPRCGAGFNPRCRLHRDRYFEPRAEGRLG